MSNNPLLIQTRLATPADATYIIHLHRTLTEFLGFIPADGIREHIHYNHVTIATAPDLYGTTPCGYIITGAPRAECRIFQIAVPRTQWRQTIGTSLIDAIGRQLTPCGVVDFSLRCRDGIPANNFWRDIGFTLRSIQLGGMKRRKVVCHWQRPAAEPRSLSTAAWRRGSAAAR